MFFLKNKSGSVSFLLLLFFVKLNSQSGITTSSAYLLKSIFSIDEKKYSGSLGWAVQYGYSLPVSKKRFEIRPELSFSRFENDHNNLSLAALFVIYPLDINGDCSCPTFGKNKFNWKSKLRLSAGPLAWVSRAVIVGELNTYTLRGFSPGLTASAGLDFPISDKITLTPLLQGHLLFNIPVFSEGVLSYSYRSTDNFIGMAGLQIRF